jgi:hypothetical protein
MDERDPDEALRTAKALFWRPIERLHWERVPGVLLHFLWALVVIWALVMALGCIATFVWVIVGYHAPPVSAEHMVVIGLMELMAGIIVGAWDVHDARDKRRGLAKP